jgi:hypothetical protein
VDAVIVLLLLGVIWAAVLLPPWLQNRRERRPIASIRSFHRQLWLLERTSPGYPAVATGGPYRSVTVYGGDDDFGYVDGDYEYESHDDYGHGYAYDDDYGEPGGYDGRGADDGFVGEDDYESDYEDAGDVRTARRPVGLAYAGEPWVAGEPSSNGSGRVAGRAAAGTVSVVDDRWAELNEARRRAAFERSPAEVRRRLQGYRRRRRVLATLLVIAVATAIPAALLSGVGWWIGHGVADVLLAGYVALLVQRQRRTIEREEKVHYLAPIRAPRPPVVVLGGGAAH